MQMLIRTNNVKHLLIASHMQISYIILFFYFYDYKQLHKFKCNVSCCELKYCMHFNVYKVNMHLLTRTNNQHSVKIWKYLTCFIYKKIRFELVFNSFVFHFQFYDYNNLSLSVKTRINSSNYIMFLMCIFQFITT